MAAIINQHKSGGLNSRNLLSYCSGGHKSETKVPINRDSLPQKCLSFFFLLPFNTYELLISRMFDLIFLDQENRSMSLPAFAGA